MYLRANHAAALDHGNVSTSFESRSVVPSVVQSFRMGTWNLIATLFLRIAAITAKQLSSIVAIHPY